MGINPESPRIESKTPDFGVTILDVGDDTDQTMGLLLVAFSMSGRMGL
jgi:hypothetical protein